MSDHLLRRVLNANYRIGGPSNAQAIATLANSDNVPDHIRKEALFTLTHWGEPPVLDRVTNEYRPLPGRSLESARDAVQQVLDPLLAGPDPLRTAAVELVSTFRLEGADAKLLEFVQQSDEPDALRAASMTALAAVDSPMVTAALRSALDATTPLTRIAAWRALASRDAERTAGILKEVLATNSSTADERQAAVELLAASEHAAARELLKEWVNLLAVNASQVPAEIQLDLQLAGQSAGLLESPTLDPATVTPEELLARYRFCLAGGDVERGREVFFGAAAASCRRCHKVNGEGSDVGPDLSGVSKEKDRAYLLESIVVPNAKIAKGFETAVFILDDGRVLSGIVKGEDAESFQIATPQGELIRIPKDTIDDQTTGRTGMPEDLFKSLSPRDVRDLVEFLSTFKTPATATGAHGKE
ncbi:MAG: c-type cytochrome [Planctomycetaceae bacterium]